MRRLRHRNVANQRQHQDLKPGNLILEPVFFFIVTLKPLWFLISLAAKMQAIIVSAFTMASLVLWVATGDSD